MFCAKKVCPPSYRELYHAMYAHVCTLLNGGLLDCGVGRLTACCVCCALAATRPFPVEWTKDVSTVAFFLF
jgi:hypothetical protein